MVMVKDVFGELPRAVRSAVRKTLAGARTAAGKCVAGSNIGKSDVLGQYKAL